MKYTRRKFLSATGTLLAGSTVSPLLAQPFKTTTAAKETVRLALIGCRNMGWHNLSNMLKVPGVTCSTLCDVDENVLQEKAGLLLKDANTKPKLEGDYRRVLEDPDIDAVIIGTPDHWHCLMTVDACEAGKDVYVEKPVANSIAEAEVMVQAARKYGRIVQVGQQQRSGQHWQDAIEYVKSGKIGTLRKIKCWANFPYGKTAPKVPDSEVPKGIDYDYWLGPAPFRPFNTGRFHGNWRFSWDYGGGLMTDWGVHLLDIPLWYLDGKMPTAIHSIGGKFAYPENALETADTQNVWYEYDDLIVEWEHLGGTSSKQYGRNYGVAFIGNDGTLVINRESWEVIPEVESGTELTETVQPREGDKNSHLKHTANFIDCIKSREIPNADIQVGKDAAILAHMGNIAYRVGETLHWDASSGKFNSDNANQLLQPSYREPWKFPQL